MKNSFDLKLYNLEYNAYCLIGNEKTAIKLVKQLTDQFALIREGNPDFFYKKIENFSIDDARNLKAEHEIKPVRQDGKKIFIIIVENILHEAQNALLKLFEEPNTETHFFLVVPSRNLLLPTVKSRLHFVESTKEENREVSDMQDLADKFIKANKAKRLEIIKKIVDDISKDKVSKIYAVDFVDCLEKIIHSQGVKENQEKLEALSLVSKYINDRAPSVKMLLEYLALSL